MVGTQQLLQHTQLCSVYTLFPLMLYRKEKTKSNIQLNSVMHRLAVGVHS